METGRPVMWLRSPETLAFHPRYPSLHPGVQDMRTGSFCFPFGTAPGLWLDGSRASIHPRPVPSQTRLFPADHYLVPLFSGWREMGGALGRSQTQSHASCMEAPKEKVYFVFLHQVSLA